jgi:membrane protease YdiL (CAAX protease family)
VAGGSLDSPASPIDPPAPTAESGRRRRNSVVQAIVVGMVVMVAGTMPRNIFFAANLRFGTGLPWAVPITGVYLWFFWRYLAGNGPPADTQQWRRASLRANPLSARAWTWSIVAGGFGLVALVLGLRVANRLVALPPQTLPDLSGIPALTLWSLMLAGAPVAGLVEEASFRGYMQQPLERAHGPTVAILVTGTMFAVAHLDFTLVLWPYYVAVAAIYGLVVWLTNSIWPAIVLHTAGNLYSNTDLLLSGHAEWQAPASQSALVWSIGADRPFMGAVAGFLLVGAVTAWSFRRLALVTRAERAQPRAHPGQHPLET